jgi:copper(I)-binding protein
LKEGTKFAATLEFEKAAKIDVTFDVQVEGAQTPMPGGSEHDMADQPGRRM